MTKKITTNSGGTKGQPKSNKTRRQKDTHTHTHKRGNKNNTENDIHKVVIIT